MKVKILVGILVLLITINLGTLGSYLYFRWIHIDRTPPAGARFRSSFERPERSKIKLEREQRVQLRQLLGDYHNESDSLRKEMWETENELFSLLHQTRIPMDSVNAALEKISDIRLRISQLAVKKMIAAKSFLTLEQQRHFFNMILQSRPDRPQEGHGFPRRHDPPAPDFDELNYF